MRFKLLCLVTLCLLPGITTPQSVSSSAQLSSDTISNAWEFEANAYYYVMPGDKNTTTLIGTADHEALHMEARYNYEDQKTFSLFGGYNFETGNELVLDLTPMLGFAVGNINGLIPGLELNLTWGIFDYYSESEYVFDFEGIENDYFYTWAELGITPFKSVRIGGVVTRTILYQSDPEFEYGALVQYSFRNLKAMVYYFNPFSKNDSYLIPTFGIEF